MENIDVIVGGAAASPSLFDNTLINTTNGVSDYIEEPVMGEDNRLHATVHYKGATFDFCPSVFRDMRVVILLGKVLDDADDTDSKAQDMIRLLRLLFGADGGFEVMSAIADANNGEFVVDDFYPLLTFLINNTNSKN